jgi:hypothetical protein
MFGSSEGNSTLYESIDPTTKERYAWTSKMVYSALPLNAGFLPFAVDERGANVPAIFAAFFLSSLSTSTSVLVETPEVVPSSSAVARTRRRRRAGPDRGAARVVAVVTVRGDRIRWVRAARGAHRIEQLALRVAIASTWAVMILSG